MQTDEQNAAEIAALRRELAGYEARGLAERAGAVRKRLAELGDAPAETEPARGRASSTRLRPTGSSTR